MQVWPKLEKYVQIFGKLRTDRGRDRYPEITNHRAPHKPSLLLSVMDLIAQGRITENFIEPSYELVGTFNTYWEAIMPHPLRLRGTIQRAVWGLGRLSQEAAQGRKGLLVKLFKGSCFALTVRTNFTILLPLLIGLLCFQT